ncbi:MAG: chromosome partitioning protein [Bradymonadia bacterium]|jgi:chromosome partitioning protein
MSSSPTRGSLHVLREAPATAAQETCAQCGAAFELRYAFQQVAVRDQTLKLCSQHCRTEALSAFAAKKPRFADGPIKIAVLNQKGGTGKTTTAVHLATGLAERERKVLIVDLDAQGHVGVSLGLQPERTLAHVVLEGLSPRECVVPLTPHLDVLGSSQALASVEIFLARQSDGRHSVLRDRLSTATDYDYVIMDCGPSLSLLNLNALTYADELIVPVSCDYLSLVGVRQLLQTIQEVNERLMERVSIMGVLPTFYDQRNRISDESVKSMKSHFGDRVLPPIRVNTRLKEAPSYQKTIYDYAPSSRGAADYRRLVEHVIRHFES